VKVYYCCNVLVAQAGAGKVLGDMKTLI